MQSNDLRMTREEARRNLMQAIKDDNKEAYAQAMNDMMQCIENEIMQKHEIQLEDVRSAADRQVLAAPPAKRISTTRSWPTLCAVRTRNRR